MMKVVKSYIYTDLILTFILHTTFLSNVPPQSYQISPSTLLFELIKINV